MTWILRRPLELCNRVIRLGSGFIFVGDLFYFTSLATVQRIRTGKSVGEQKQKQESRWSAPQ